MVGLARDQNQMVLSLNTDSPWQFHCRESLIKGGPQFLGEQAFSNLNLRRLLETELK